MTISAVVGTNVRDLVNRLSVVLEEEKSVAPLDMERLENS